MIVDSILCNFLLNIALSFSSIFSFGFGLLLFGLLLLLLLLELGLLFDLGHDGGGFLDHFFGFELLGVEVLGTFLLEFGNDGKELGIFFHFESVKIGFDEVLLNVGLVEEEISGLELFVLDDLVDRIWGKSLSADELVHLLLGVELGLLHETDTVEYFFTCQFILDRSHACVSNLLHLLLKGGSLLRVHHVHLTRLFADLSRYVDTLDGEEESLNILDNLTLEFSSLCASASVLGFPGFSFLEDGTTLDSFFLQDGFAEAGDVLVLNFAGLDEVLESESLVGLHFGLSEVGGFDTHSVNLFLARGDDGQKLL